MAEPKMPKPMTQKEYVESKGKCPYCGADGNHQESFDQDFCMSKFRITVKCNACKKFWTEVYTLNSYEEHEGDDSNA